MVAVYDQKMNVLMPCSEKRASKMMDKGEAKPFWNKGMFCIILQKEPSGRDIQDICLAIDPGSKFNGLAIKSKANTILNIQYNSITWVKDRVSSRAELRGSRRFRNTPYRKCRWNRGYSKAEKRVPPSTKARWQQHLNMIKWMSTMFNITVIGFEDISAETIKNKDGKQNRYNLTFSPLQVGKNWLREEVEKMGHEIIYYKGFETYKLREKFNLNKNSNKTKEDFYSHCVDSWAISNDIIGGHDVPDSIHVKFMKPIKIGSRRQLHVTKPAKGGVRKRYGGTISLGIKTNTLVKHLKYGVATVGGYTTIRGKDGLSLHCIKTGKRLCQNAKVEDLEIKTNIKYYIK